MYCMRPANCWAGAFRAVLECCLRVQIGCWTTEKMKDVKGGEWVHRRRKMNRSSCGNAVDRIISCWLIFIFRVLYATGNPDVVDIIFFSSLIVLLELSRFYYHNMLHYVLSDSHQHAPNEHADFRHIEWPRKRNSTCLSCVTCWQHICSVTTTEIITMLHNYTQQRQFPRDLHLNNWWLFTFVQKSCVCPAQCVRDFFDCSRLGAQMQATFVLHNHHTVWSENVWARVAIPTVCSAPKPSSAVTHMHDLQSDLILVGICIINGV